MKEIKQLISLILWICLIGLIFGVAVPAFKEGRENAKREALQAAPQALK